jgi:tRNA-splicing ligase RtcB
MNLAGDYASACHDDIHRRLVKAVGGRVKAELKIITICLERDHNGKEVIVHRKGSYSANENELGMIPGSMTAKGFIVRGKGNRTH